LLGKKTTILPFPISAFLLASDMYNQLFDVKLLHPSPNVTITICTLMLRCNAIRKLISYFSCLASAEYNDGSHTHHHQAPNGTAAPRNEVRQAHQFYPTYPTATGMVSAGIPTSGDGIEHMGGHAPSHATAVATSSSSAAAAGRQQEEDEDDDDERNVALFGDLPEAKRRKFILVDDAQRGTRVRVRVMLDQVKMHEMPDSYRKNNSVYPRSWFATEMQSPPPEPRRGRWPDDVDGGEPGAVEVKTLVPVPMMDGSEAKVPVPRMNRTKRAKEVTLNDLGYRMSWSQSRVFSGRTLFLQRSRE